MEDGAITDCEGCPIVGDGGGSLAGMRHLARSVPIDGGKKSGSNFGLEGCRLNARGHWPGKQAAKHVEGRLFMN